MVEKFVQNMVCILDRGIKGRLTMDHRQVPWEKGQLATICPLLKRPDIVDPTGARRVLSAI